LFQQRFNLFAYPEPKCPTRFFYGTGILKKENRRVEIIQCCGRVWITQGEIFIHGFGHCAARQHAAVFCGSLKVGFFFSAAQPIHAALQNRERFGWVGE